MKVAKKPMTKTLRIISVALTSLSLSLACTASKADSKSADNALNDLREDAQSDDQLAATWLLSELLQPGGDALKAVQARQALDKSNRHGMFEDLARGLDDDLHGRLRTASDHYLRAAKAARKSKHSAAQLVGWFAVRRAVSLRANTQDLWKRWKKWVEATLNDPQQLGWRGRDVLVEWWSNESWVEATKDIEQLAAKEFGCLDQVRLAGPFGSGSRASALQPFPAEAATPWPELWPEDPVYDRAPRLLETDQDGCFASVDEPTKSGVFYAETVVQTGPVKDLVLTVDNALQVWIDGIEVLNRDFRRFGSWTDVGVGVHLEPGTHRIVAKLLSGRTSVRLLDKQGKPAAIKPGQSGLPPADPPRVSFDANPKFKPDAQAPGESAVLRYIAGFLAHLDGEDGVATMLMEPLVEDTKIATGPALSMAATFVEGDPIYNSSQTEDLMRELHQTALKRDPNLWEADLEHVAQLAKSKGLVDAVPELKQLTERYQQVPALLSALAKVYGELGWTPEYREVVLLSAQRFPDDPEGLYSAAQLLEADGEVEKAKQLYARIQKLDPDSEVMIGRALERQDYDAALAELKRLHARRPARKDLIHRIENVKRLAGEEFDIWKILNEAIEKQPKNGRARLALADAKFARGERNALDAALVDALQKGANTAAIKNALDLIEGLTELEPYRLDGQQVIRDYEAAGKHMPGTAARVLDYMAVLVSADGSSRSLEHQVIRLQSEEAIRRFAEHSASGDVILKMRVIKKDGRILEPEPVAGKPTVTFPHLEVGDYIETEQIYSSDSTGGSVYEGPHWFFREKDVAYARSELVLVSPSAKQLDVATTGNVPEPTITRDGYFEVRRWRVDQSPAAPNEPLSVPPTEYLPSVQVTWGLDLDRHLHLLAERVQQTVATDPRVVRIAKRIVAGIPAANESARARALYRWVLSNVQDGEEDDGRRVIVGKRGNRWRGLVTLCRSLDIPVKWAVAKNRLSAPPTGPADAARQFSATALKIGQKEPVWLTINDEHTPFGYLPSEIRGMPAYLLEMHDPAQVTLPEGGAQDMVAFIGSVNLAADGSATLELAQGYHGRLGAALRKGLTELGEQRVNDVVESKILASALRGARLTGLEVEDLDNNDVPLVLQMKGEMAHFALAQGKVLRLSPPFVPRLSQFATLPTRQTPILLASERRWEVDLKIQLPAGAKVKPAPKAHLTFADHLVEVNDTLDNGVLHLRRNVHLRSGRIAPEDYAEFVRFTRDADSALSSEITIQVP